MNPDPLKNIRVVLCRPAHPGNIGAAARAMKTMGLADLVLVMPHAFPDPAARARAAGALDVLEHARVVATLDEALADTVLAVATTARQRELRHEFLTARSAAERLMREVPRGRVALVFGNETCGLTREEAGRCQLFACIPASDGYASLNLAAAVQVFCYELRMAAGAGLPERPAEFAPASLREIEDLVAHLERALVTIGFLDPAHPKRLLPRLRRLIARAALEHEEVSILRGILAAMEARGRR
jgi:tRNA/rRNA methyltransferase